MSAAPKVRWTPRGAALAGAVGGALLTLLVGTVVWPDHEPDGSAEKIGAVDVPAVPPAPAPTDISAAGVTERSPSGSAGEGDDGEGTAAGQSGEEPDSAPLVADAPPAGKGALPDTTPITCPDPTTTVTDSGELAAALDGARPGDVIEMADGTYPGNFVTTVSGEKHAPIFLCGSAGAVIDGGDIEGDYTFHLDGADYWRLVGFTVTGGLKGVMADGTVGSVIQGLTVTGIGDEAIHLRADSTDNVVADNTVSDTGNRRDDYGEGVYIGTAVSNWCTYTACRADRSDRNDVVDNTFSDVTSEAIDIKEGTTGGLVQRQHLRRLRYDRRRLLGGREGQRLPIEDNAGVTSTKDGFQTHQILDGWGDFNVFRANDADVRGPGFAIASPVRGSTSSTAATSSSAPARASPTSPAPEPHQPDRGTSRGRSFSHARNTVNQGEIMSSTTANKPRITVIGTGYLGATHAICMAVLGFEVLGVDVDRTKIEALARGEVPFFEPGLPEMLRKALDAGQLSFTTDLAAAGDFGDVHFVCVGTPQRQDSAGADLSYVEGVVRDLAPHLRRRCLVVGKSTVPVGTAARLTQIVQDNAPAGTEVELAWNPEFLREGYAVEDTLQPDRMVFGVASPWAEAQLRATFAPVLDAGTPVVTTDLATAELVKVAANSFLATKISYINAMAEVCEATGADVQDLAESLSYDSRIGGRFLHPGLGFGGGCLPKDIRAFVHRAEELGVGRSVAFLRQVDAINKRRRARTVDLVREQAGGSLAGVRICCLGAAFKPNSDDIRDAPALDVARMLQDEGAVVAVYDPEAMGNARKAYPDLEYADSVMQAAADARVVVLLTEWDQFRSIDPAVLAEVATGHSVVDGRHALDADAWRRAGWTYRALGRAN